MSSMASYISPEGIPKIHPKIDAISEIKVAMIATIVFFVLSSITHSPIKLVCVGMKLLSRGKGSVARG